MKSRLFATADTAGAETKRKRDEEKEKREMKGKREKATLYPCDLPVLSFLCGSVPLWLLMR